MSGVETLSATNIASLVLSGRSRALHVIEQTLSLIARRDPELNAFTQVLADQALRDARRIDAEVLRGRHPGPLTGVPFAVKNLFDVAGLTTLAGSIIDAENPPASVDSPLVARLRAAGAILVGCLNMDEYAYGFTTENAHHGATRNPHDLTRVAGGSSGGSAAAVAAGLTPISLGSDTNGSIRVPAALCGVYGLKPTFGRLSRRGARPFVHSLDHTGPFARTVADLALVYDILQGPDPLDPACAQRPAEAVTPLLSAGVEGLRVGVLDGWFQHGAAAEALRSLSQVADALSATGPVVLADAEAARAAAFCLTAAEGGALHLAELRARPHMFTPTTRDRLMAGSMLPARIIIQAQRFRRRFLETVLAMFERYDLLLAPTTPFTAPPVGQATIRLAGTDVSVRANLGVYTQPLSFVGLPVISVPVTPAGALPTGVQLIAAPWREDLVFRAASHLERAGVIGSATQELSHGS